MTSRLALATAFALAAVSSAAAAPVIGDTDFLSIGNDEERTSAHVGRQDFDSSGTTPLQLSLLSRIPIGREPKVPQLAPRTYDVTGLRLFGFSSENVNVRGIDLGFGLAETNGNFDGIQGSLVSATEGEARGIQLAGLVGASNDGTFGIQGAGAVLASGGDIAGIQLAGLVVGADGEATGIQAAGLVMAADDDMTGIQLAGLVQGGDGDATGIQGAMLVQGLDGDANGLQFGGIVQGNDGDALGVQMAGVVAASSGNATGIRLAGLVSAVGGDMGGVSAAMGVVETDGDANGLSIGGLHAGTDTGNGLLLSAGVARAQAFNGFQIGGLHTAGETSGLAASLLLNGEPAWLWGDLETRTAPRGLQLGAYNDAEEVHGVQFGIANTVTDEKESTVHGAQVGGVNVSKRVSGFQFGLVNVATEDAGVQIGVINWDEDGIGFPLLNW